MGVVFEDVIRLKVGGATGPQVFVFIKDSQRVYRQCKMQCKYITSCLVPVLNAPEQLKHATDGCVSMYLYVCSAV